MTWEEILSIAACVAIATATCVGVVAVLGRLSC